MFQDNAGVWHGWVSMGIAPSGRRVRRHVRGTIPWRSIPVLVARYAHVVEQAKRDAAQRIGDVLWSDP